MTIETSAKERRCPVCGKPTEARYRPFCSARCRDVDLARWLGGGYVIAGGAVTDDDEDGAAPAGGRGEGTDDEDDPG